MKKLFTACFIFLAFYATAQITIVRSDYGNVGDLVRFAVDTPAPSSLNSTILTTGANKTWNFASSLIANRYDSMRFSAPGTGAPAGANLLMSTATSSQYQYVDTTGVRIILDQPTFNLTGLSLKIFKFPFTNGSISIDTLNYFRKGTVADFNLTILSSFGYDSVKAYIKGWDTTTCAGFGTVNLPDTSTNVIQVKVVAISDINLFGHSALTGWSSLNSLAQSLGGVTLHQKTVEYQWIGKNSKSYFARASMDTTSGNTVQSFTYMVKKIIVPTIKSITPANAQRGQTLNVNITCSNTHFTQALTIPVTFVSGTNILLVNSVTILNDSMLKANITVTQSNVLGGYALGITDPVYGQISMPNAFTVAASSNPPALKSVSPKSANPGVTLNISIVSTATHFTQSTSSLIVTFMNGGTPTTKIKINSTTPGNDSTISCSISIDTTGAIGKYSIQVTNQVDGTMILTDSFSVIAKPGINETGLISSGILVYPNPLANELQIKSDQYSIRAEVVISDLSGKQLSVFQMNGNTINVDVSNLESGIYFCTIRNEAFTTTRKLIINK